MAALQSEPPPSYTEATKDAPPTYQQVFGMGMKDDIMEARETSSNHGSFAVKFCQICCGSIACLLCYLILASLPVAMIVIGGIYLDDCSANGSSAQGGKIPIWLIVFGCVSIVQTIIGVIKRCFRKKRDSDEESGSSTNYGERSGSGIETLISFFLFIWIIVGSVWVFGFYDQFAGLGCREDFNGPLVDVCCHPVPFLFSFSVLILFYGLSILFCFCCCCIFCIAAAASSE